MAGPLQRRLIVLLGAAAAGFACWKTLPGKSLDKAAFTSIAGGFANPPYFISGHGSHADPWKLRTFSADHKPDTRQAPVIVSLGDDVDGFFQTSPPSPVDLAVILTNFQRLGARKAATAGVLAWEKPDVIGLTALEKAIGKFDSLVMAAPLSRGPVAETMPPAFRNASVSIDAVLGDTSSLPVVNRIPLPGVILGKEKTLAGFQTLESETASDAPPLMARWEDRVVFAFPLLTVMQRLDLTVEQLEIRPGKFLRLGPDGPTVPIDRYGRLVSELKRVSPYAVIPAENLIDGGDDLFPKQAPEPVILRDDRSAAEPATRYFSQNLSTVIATIASDDSLAAARAYRRPGPGAEAAMISLTALVLAAFAGLPAFPRNIAFLTIAAVCLAAQIIGMAAEDWWLPGLHSLAAVCGAIVVARNPVPPLPGPEQTEVKTPPPPAEPESAPPGIPAPEKPAKKKDARREKKTITAKAPAKKAPAKKAARKSTRTKKS